MPLEEFVHLTAEYIALVINLLARNSHTPPSIFLLLPQEPGTNYYHCNL